MILEAERLGLCPDSMFILNLIFLIYKMKRIILYFPSREKSKEQDTEVRGSMSSRKSWELGVTGV